jgi:preprotein translocase subunit SecG
MQSSKGEGLAGSAFGGGGALSGAVFGGRGATTFLQKATTVLAVLFMLNCGALAFMSSNRSAPTDASQVTESAVTRQAQREMEESMQRQQQQQQLAQPVDTAGGAVNLLQQEAAENPSETPTETPDKNPDQSSGN